MLPIAQDFNVPLTAVTPVFTITLWLRLAGATASGWLSDRIGGKKPLMISILWYSICNLLVGIAPGFGLLFLFRALLGIGMGAEWCGIGDGDVASTFARSHGENPASVMGNWRPAIQWGVCTVI